MSIRYGVPASFLCLWRKSPTAGETPRQKLQRAANRRPQLDPIVHCRQCFFPSLLLAAQPLRSIRNFAGTGNQHSFPPPPNVDEIFTLSKSNDTSSLASLSLSHCLSPHDLSLPGSSRQALRPEQPRGGLLVPGCLCGRHSRCLGFGIFFGSRLSRPANLFAYLPICTLVSLPSSYLSPSLVFTLVPLHLLRPRPSPFRLPSTRQHLAPGAI